MLIPVKDGGRSHLAALWGGTGMQFSAVGIQQVGGPVPRHRRERRRGRDSVDAPAARQVGHQAADDGEASAGRSSSVRRRQRGREELHDGCRRMFGRRSGAACRVPGVSGTRRWWRRPWWPRCCTGRAWRRAGRPRTVGSSGLEFRSTFRRIAERRLCRRIPQRMNLSPLDASFRA